jgi:DNA-3-methyladenine glycosylase II
MPATPPAPTRLDDELLARAHRALRRRDPVLGAVIRRVGPPRIRRRGAPYRSLLRSILFQQLAGSAARAIEARFVALHGGRVPEPEALLATSEVELRKAGLSRQKIAAMKAVARAFRDGEVRPRRFPHMSDEEIVATVTRIRGIGEWTAHMTLMFSLGRPDVLPVGDYGVRKGMQQLYGLRELPKPAAMEHIAEAWRPYRTVGSWYIWRHLDPVAGGG